jgi:uroporphyrinogen decarboxylase
MTQKMTGQERVLAALSHKEPDRIPIDFGGTRVSSMVVEGYERLKAHFGVSAETEICERMMRVVKVDEEILKALDIDTRAIFPGAPTNGLSKEPGPRAWRDSWGVERFHLKGSYYYEQLSAPLAGEITLSDVVKYPWPDPEDPGLLKGMKERLQWVRTHTDAAAVLTLPAPFVHISQYVRGYEDWYKDLIKSPKVLGALFDAILEVNLRIAERELEEVGKEVDIVICGDDLGAQQGLQISHDHFAQYIRPRLKKYFDLIHRLSPAKLALHSCGSLASIIGDLIDIGVDVINPVQVTAAGMDPVELKRKYGEQLSFWGAMDTQRVLPFGTVKDVRKMVEERIEQLGRGGGFILSSCHNIQPEIPVEKIVALFEHAREYKPSFSSGANL